VLVPPPTAPVELPPTLVPDAPTVAVPPRETTVDPLVAPPPVTPPPPSVTPPSPLVTPPPAPTAPGWSAPAAAPPPAPGWSSPTATPPAAPGWSSPATPPPVAPGWAPVPGAPGSGQQAYPQPLYGQQPVYGSAYPTPGLPGVAGWGAVPQAPKPGVIPLRPLGIGEILDGAISYVRRDPKTVLGISALVAAASALLQLVLYGALSRAFTPLLNLSTAPSGGTSAEFDAAMRDLTGGLAGLAAALVAVGLVTYILNVLATGLLTTAMGRAVLGKPVSTSDVWRRAAGRFWPLLGVTLLVSLILSVSLVVGLAVAVLLGVLIGQASSGLGALVGVLLGLGVGVGFVWLYVKLLLSPVALVLEGVGPVTAIKRSYALVGGAWWRTFGIHLLAVIIAAVVSQVITVPFGLIGGVISASTAGSSGALDPFSFTQSLVTALSTLVSSTIVIPFSAGVISLLYIDRRIRREALDIELARAAGVPGA
jgi:hypothetical protein